MNWGDVFKSFLVLFLIFGCLSCTSPEKQAEKHFKKGFEYQNQGNLDKAIEEYQKALQLKPNYTQVYTNLGTVYLSCLSGPPTRQVTAFFPPGQGTWRARKNKLASEYGL